MSKTGTISELKAQVWLLEQGYEVFSNVKPSGKTDLIIWDTETNEITKIDVKTVRIYYKADGSKSYNFSGLGTVGYESARIRKTNDVEYLGYCIEEDRFLWFNDLDI